MKISPQLEQEILSRPGTTVTRCGAVVDGKPEEPKRSKYGAVKTEVDGMKFDSKKEARRYLELKAMQAAGKISGLGMQPAFPLTMYSGKNIGVYKADFSYLENGVPVVEDCKGFKTPVYRLKKRMFEAQYGIKIRET